MYCDDGTSEFLVGRDTEIVDAIMSINRLNGCCHVYTFGFGFWLINEQIRDLWQ